MTDQITLTLPLPPACLSPNARSHWAAKAKAIRQYRAMACLIARQQAPASPWWSASYSLLFSLPRRQDADNLVASIKSGIDGIADAGIIANDSGLRLTGVEVISGKKATGGNYFVRITITKET